MLPYSVTKSNRKTIAMFIERNNDIVIKAPLHANEDKIANFFRRKQIRLHTKLEEKKFFDTNPRAKKFVNGEMFYYLGRTYKLKIQENIPVKFRWYRSTFELQEAFVDSGREIIIERYKDKCREKILPRVAECSKRYGFIYKDVGIKDLRNRRASCSPANIINFHWKLILAPIDVIDYVILHELVHTKEKKHSPKFWTTVSSLMPDYENHKDWLRRNGVALYA